MFPHLVKSSLAEVLVSTMPGNCEQDVSSWKRLWVGPAMTDTCVHGMPFLKWVHSYRTTISQTYLKIRERKLYFIQNLDIFIDVISWMTQNKGETWNYDTKSWNIVICTKYFQILLLSSSWIFSATRLKPVCFSEVDCICCSLRLVFC